MPLMQQYDFKYFIMITEKNLKSYHYMKMISIRWEYLKQ